LSGVRGPRTLAALRARVGDRIDRLFGADAPIVRALVIADMSGIPIEQRDRFARAGLVHMLSVSGLHVAIIALALELLATALRAPPTVARVTALAVIALYVAGIGAPPPAVRAAVMLGLLAVSRIAQRPTSPWAIVAVGGVAPLVDPRTVLDLGWQLSVAGTIALVAGGALSSRVIPRPWRGHRRALTRATIVGLVATAVTAPLVAWTFGRVSLLGPLSNLVADPVMALLQPTLFLALCIPVPAIEHLTVDSAHLLILAFDAVATRVAAIPGGAPSVLPTTMAACAGGVAALAIVVACVADRWARALVVALGCIGVMLIEPYATPTHATTELHMLDVGQGDAIAIRTRAGRWIVVDAGRTWNGGDAGRSIVAPYIARRGGSVALFVLSHPHADHVGGAASLFAALHPGRFLDPGYVGTTPAYLAALREARGDGIAWQRVRPGDSLVVDEAVLTALAPDSAWAATLTDANLASTVLMVRVGSVRFLLTGDAEAPEERWLLAHDSLALAADVLKVAHHGSATSTTTPFLAAVHPRVALVSVGAHNSYGHPDAAVMRSLAAAGAAVLRTDRLGTVVVRTDGRSLEVEAQGMRWSVP
jgi:competence protein ComEC